MNTQSRWLGILAFLVLAALAGCGGGGGGGDSTVPAPANPGGGGGGGGTPTGPAAPVHAGFDFSLAAGDFWRFGWDATRSSFAQGSGTSSGSATSTFQVKLGNSIVIAGVTMYPVQLSGNPTAIVNGDSVSLAPRWLHIGMDGSREIGRAHV